MIQAAIADGLDKPTTGMKTYAGHPSVDAYVRSPACGGLADSCCRCASLQLLPAATLQLVPYCMSACRA